MTLFMRGLGAEILEQLRLAAFDPTEFPDTESYLWQLRSNFIRMRTGTVSAGARSGGAGTGTVWGTGENWCAGGAGKWLRESCTSPMGAISTWIRWPSAAQTPRWWDQSHWRIMNFCSAAICGAPEWPPSLPGRGAQYTACCGTSRQSVSAPWIIMRVTLTCMGRSR